MSDPAISVVIPTLNEASRIESLLNTLQDARARNCEIVVVDGGSSDETVRLARPLADVVTIHAPGRAAQLHAGAQRARGAILWFLHADSRIPADADQLIRAALHRTPRAWGHFDVRLEPESGLLRVVRAAMNLRVRITHVATGDHGLFVSRELYTAIGGMPQLELMEDVELSKRLRAKIRPVRIPFAISTSARRWLAHGVLCTIFKMWSLRLLYFLGVAPRRLARFYPPQA